MLTSRPARITPVPAIAAAMTCASIVVLGADLVPATEGPDR